MSDYKNSVQLTVLCAFFLPFMIIMIFCLIHSAITFGDMNGILSLQSIRETHFRLYMLHSGKCYQPVSEMSEVTELLNPGWRKPISKS